MDTATLPAAPFASPRASHGSAPPWLVEPAVRPIAARKPARAWARLLPLIDSSVIAITLLTAASLLLGSHGAHAPAPRDLGPVVIVTTSR